MAVGQETDLFSKWCPLNHNAYLWRHLGGLSIQGSSSAGTAASSPVAHQTTSIHQHKSAQRGANCIRRPPFLSGLCVWVAGCGCVEESRVDVRGKRRGLARSVGCLRSRGGRVWRCGGSWPSPQAFRQASPLSPLQLLATSPTPFTHTHKHKYRGRDKLAFLRSQQTIVTCSLSRRLTG